jgi:hypothetical protein
MPQQELLKKVIHALESIPIDYMVTGSLASSFYGEPRSTHDIDLVVTIQKTDIKNLMKFFRSPRFYLDEGAVVQAVENRDMFNLIDTKEGDKIDFWILTDDSFDQSRFSRRRKEKAAGFHMQVSTPEDTILMKLKWAKLSGGSEKQFTDALRVYEVQAGELDMDYLEKWINQLDLDPFWRDLKAKAQV